MPDSAASQNENTLAPQLRLFVATQLALTLACVLTEVYCHYVLHLKIPYDYPFLARGQSFYDFIFFTHKFHHFHNSAFFTTESFYPFMYPAPVAVFLEAFFIFGPVALLLFIAFLFLSFAFAGRLLERALWARGVPREVASRFLGVSLLLSYPLWFEFKQGNAEIAVWVFVAAGVWAFCKGRDYNAAACFGIAGSMKIYPFIYLGLLLSRRKYREIAFSAAIAIVTTLASLWLVGGNGILGTWRRTQAGIDAFRTIYILHYRQNEIGFDHSLFAVYKRFRHPLPPPDGLAHVLTVYLAVAAIAGIALYFLRIRHLPIANQVLCLCIASILLPPVSGDYTLMHLYVPWGMLVLIAQDRWNLRQKLPGLLAAFVCLAILVSPESEFIAGGERFAGQIKAVVLLTLLFIGLRYPFEAPRPNRRVDRRAP